MRSYLACAILGAMVGVWLAIVTLSTLEAMK